MSRRQLCEGLSSIVFERTDNVQYINQCSKGNIILRAAAINQIIDVIKIYRFVRVLLPVHHQSNTLKLQRNTAFIQETK